MIRNGRLYDQLETTSLFYHELSQVLVNARPNTHDVKGKRFAGAKLGDYAAACAAFFGLFQSRPRDPTQRRGTMRPTPFGRGLVALPPDRLTFCVRLLRPSERPAGGPRKA